ncbi:MAG: hypothetical protein V1790_00985 [Planctomycetota bacterium]
MSSAWSASCTPGGHPSIDLIAPRGGSLEVTVCNEACEESAVLLRHQLLESGQYTIVVRDGAGDDTEECSLSLVSIP